LDERLPDRNHKPVDGIDHTVRLNAPLDHAVNGFFLLEYINFTDVVRDEEFAYLSGDVLTLAVFNHARMEVFQAFNGIIIAIRYLNFVDLNSYLMHISDGIFVDLRDVHGLPVEAFQIRPLASITIPS